MGYWLGFEARVAVRFLREGRLQTLLIMVGVAAGVAVIAYISALVTGLQENTFKKTLGGQPHVTLRALDDAVTSARAGVPGEQRITDTQPRAQRLRSVGNWQLMLPLLERMPQVAAVSPMVAGGGLALRGEATQSIALAGVDLDRYDRVVRLREKVVAGVASAGAGIGRRGFLDLLAATDGDGRRQSGKQQGAGDAGSGCVHGRVPRRLNLFRGLNGQAV